MKDGIGLVLMVAMITQPAWAQQTLKVVYPPPNYETTSDRIFLIGTASPDAAVTVNRQTVRDRSSAGHFSPSFPLQVGDNTFTLRSKAQTLTLTVRRTSTAPLLGTGFAAGSLTPSADIARLPNEPICFSAIAPPNAQVAVYLAKRTIPLTPQTAVDLPPNSAVLTASNQLTTAQFGLYKGCTAFTESGSLGKPVFEMRQGSKAIIPQIGAGQVTILPPQIMLVSEVTSVQGVARTGPGTDYSRLTPLPEGTQARITGRDGEWLRLDYGGWIKQSETRPVPNAVSVQSLIRSVRVQTFLDQTKIIFPLQVPVPVTLQQGDRTMTLTLYNTTAQTDTILQTPDPVLSRLDWQQSAPGQVKYELQLKNQQQWGYQLSYEGTSLVLSLRHPPSLRKPSLSGTTILLDPGHGSQNDLGSVGPTGYPEKDVALLVSQHLRDELVQRGAKVVMTRTGDDDLYPNDRAAMIEKTAPTIALSLHYNALPDGGDAWNTKGVSTYWYHPQAQGLAVFLHDYLVQTLGRPSYGVYWNNLALTRPAIAPSVLIELGFMINPIEFEWVTNASAQRQLAATLADGITAWFHQ